MKKVEVDINDIIAEYDEALARANKDIILLKAENSKLRSMLEEKEEGEAHG